MEVIIPSSSPFDSASTTPYLSATSSPQRSANFFYSAPTSPTRISAFYNGGAVPFNWESKPGTPKSTSTYADAADQDLDDADFAFHFSGHLDRPSLPADELFHAGKIKPLKPPPPFHHPPPKSPRSPRQIVQQAFSPRHHRSRDDVDPFAAAIEQTRKEAADRVRGRERNKNSTNPPSSSSSSSSSTHSRERNKGSSRSLSPFRVSDLLFDHPDTIEEDQDQSKNANTSSSVFSSSFWYKKWKIKDLLLFRSASEGRAKDKEQLKKYSQLKKTRNDDVKNSSFRSTDSVGSVSSRRKSGPPISAHELHYTMNRAFSEEMRRRTSLPYKQGLLGCLGFNPTAPDLSTSMPRER